MPQSKKRNIQKFGLEVCIEYEDDFIIVVYKPGGMSVNGNRNKTLENVLRQNVKKSDLRDRLDRPIAAHRIDVPTKGLVLLAKTHTALRNLNKAFEHREIRKEYHAVLQGDIPIEGHIHQAINGKKAHSYYRRLRTVQSVRYEKLNLIRFHPSSGRTHQLRIHALNLGNGILGDKEYFLGQKNLMNKGLFLVANGLNFHHPISGHLMKIEIAIPSRFIRILDREELYFKNSQSRNKA